MYTNEETKAQPDQSDPLLDIVQKEYQPKVLIVDAMAMLQDMGKLSYLQELS